MEITQNKKSNKHTFTFNDDHFNFSYSDKSGSGDKDFNYAEFPRKCIIKIEQNEWLRNVGYLWIALGFFQLGHAIYAQASISGKGFWVVIGLACVIWAYFSKVKYSVFQAERGSIFIIQDKSHDEIINELKTRKNKQLLDWHGEINPENKADDEIEKFKWLAEQEVISQKEAETKITQIEIMYKKTPI